MSYRADKKAVILIVDDSPTNLKVLVDHLEAAGFQTLIATDGQKAIEQVGRFLPDLILLDVLMPALNGFETCRLLKADAATRTIPVIFMTALSDTDSKIKGFEVGAVDFVTKPIEYQEVLARVNTHLTIRNLQRTLEEKNLQLEQKNIELQEALTRIKTLRGLLPICASCKKIRDDEGYWQQVEVYIEEHSAVEFTHGLCPDCIKHLYPSFYREK